MRSIKNCTTFLTRNVPNNNLKPLKLHYFLFYGAAQHEFQSFHFFLKRNIIQEEKRVKFDGVENNGALYSPLFQQNLQ